MPTILLVLTVALPAAWLLADFRGGAGTRRTLGIITLVWSLGIATVFTFVESLDANAYFTVASKKLLHSSVKHLRAGRTEVVAQAWSRADDKFQWTYQNRGKYKETVEQAIAEMERP